ncbi:multidrug efflux SMR transporter [Streptomyces sp. 71268]|uniref:DMT family transporter n=1 Tax=Streptomyces sp. 71268 TaxID=3002640 RepID=UPI0023F80637|nr:multidrug efflux SMR transporter [Streptomyces sp. 71268]WEV26491.1 multidrug efflux SMR transporter [Streptomyces sp. 71268]
MAWIYLLIAAALEVIFALSTNATEGFTRLWPSLLTVAAATGGVFFLSLALKTLDVGVGYTIWTGLGSLGALSLGAVIYDEGLGLGKVISFLAIVGGVIGLKLTGGSASPDAEPRTPTPASAAEGVGPAGASAAH